MMHKIHIQLEESKKSGNAHIIEITKPMEEKFNKYWSNMQHFSAIALAFDPCCKLDLINFLLS
jgi:hypothetical protein